MNGADLLQELIGSGPVLGWFVLMAGFWIFGQVREGRDERNRLARGAAIQRYKRGQVYEDAREQLRQKGRD